MTKSAIEYKDLVDFTAHSDLTKLMSTYFDLFRIRNSVRQRAVCDILHLRKYAGAFKFFSSFGGVVFLLKGEQNNYCNKGI